MEHFDLAVIGSGAGGYRAAVLAALRGLRVALFEKDEWGGCCLNRGCVPKRAWYETAALLAAQREFPARGISGALAVDIRQAWRHQHGVTAGIRARYVGYLAQLGVRTYRGAARFRDGHTLEAGPDSVSASAIIIATGSQPRMPDTVTRTPGRILTTDDLFDHEPPSGRRVAVLGSGPAGVEFAFILAAFGLEVVWLARSPPLADRGFSDTARKVLTDALENHGIHARSVDRIGRTIVDNRGVTLALPEGEQERVDWVLSCTGRTPRTQGLALDKAGVRRDDNGFVVVDEYQRTSAPDIFAIGDVAERAMTANHALAQASIAVQNIIAPQSRQRCDKAIPTAVYSAVELARIGINADQAEAQGRDVAIGHAAFAVSPAALVENDSRGFVRVTCDADDAGLLGAEIAGTGASDLIHLLGLDIGRADALSRIAGVAYNHPTRSEEILNAVETLAAKWGLAKQVFKTSSR